MFNFIISGKWPLLIFSHRLSHYDCSSSIMVFKLHPHLQVISFKLWVKVGLLVLIWNNIVFLVKEIKIISFKKN